MEQTNRARRPLVCLFDSGIGGLNLLKECRDKIPQADFCYFADNYNVPYGNLSEEQTFRLVEGAFEKISRLRPDAAAVACNTVTARCIKALREKYEFPIIGVQPAVKQACENGGIFLVLVTRSTYSSKSFRALLTKYGRRAVLLPCDTLAAEIENNIFSLPQAGLSKRLPEGSFSSVVLGCTHYIFLKKAVEKKYCCPVFDGMSGTADHLRTILGIFDHRVEFNGKIDFFCGDFTKNRKIFENIEHLYE